MASDEQTLNIEGHPLRNPFWRELDEGLITYRDNLQFELKSEFYINPNLKRNVYTQECFIFIPETLQITPQTYTSAQFYLDQTNLIRYKTPYMSLEELIDTNNKRSPLVRIHIYKDKKLILREMMLLGNIFRSTLRVRIRRLLKDLMRASTHAPTPSISEQILLLCREIQAVRSEFHKARDHLIDRFEPNHFDKQLDYIDEFMSEVIEEYITLFLDLLRKNPDQSTTQADQALCELLEREERYRKSRKMGVFADEGPSRSKESILYHQGMLEKFLLSALKLNNNRVQLREKHAQYIGALAAGVAMFVYMILFVWKASELVINSALFVFLATIFYILKDRIKEGMKNYYARKASLWFPDYTTQIESPTGETIGKLTESFAFIDPSKLPEGFRELRLKDDEDELEAYQPVESILHYKKEVILYQHRGRLTELNTIFRYNIHRCLEKANDAIQPTLSLDAESHELKQELLPKVYHLNIILRNTYQDRNLHLCTEIKKFRVIVDKNGIRRVEHVCTSFERIEQ